MEHTWKLAQQWNQVEHLCSGFEVDKISFSSTSSSLGSCKRWIDALALLDAMASLALRPHDAMYNSLAGSLENSQRWSLASALLEEMIGQRVLESCHVFTRHWMWVTPSHLFFLGFGAVWGDHGYVFARCPCQPLLQCLFRSPDLLPSVVLPL